MFPNIKINALFRSLKDSKAAISHERISKHINNIIAYVGRPTGAPIPKGRVLDATLAAQAGVAVDNIVAAKTGQAKLCSNTSTVSPSLIIILLLLLWILNKDPSSKYNNTLNTNTMKYCTYYTRATDLCCYQLFMLYLSNLYYVQYII